MWAGQVHSRRRMAAVLGVSFRKMLEEVWNTVSVVELVEFPC